MKPSPFGEGWEGQKWRVGERAISNRKLKK